MIHWKVNVYQMIPYPTLNAPSFKQVVFDTLEFDKFNISYDEIEAKVKLHWKNVEFWIIPVSDEAKKSTKFEL